VIVDAFINRLAQVDPEFQRGALDSGGDVAVVVQDSQHGEGVVGVAVI
jgi:hypothetical protein